MTTTQDEAEFALVERARGLLPAGSLGNLDADTIIAGGLAARVWDVSVREYVHLLSGSGNLTVHNVPAGIPSDEAESRVTTTAVEKLPGVAWISIGWCGEAPESIPLLRLFKRGNGQQQSGGASDVLAGKITATMRDELSIIPPG